MQPDRLEHLARKQAARLAAQNPQRPVRLRRRSRLWERVQDAGECRLFTGVRDQAGYGRIGFRGRVDYAHRVAWTFTYGEIPPGMCVLHTCDTPPCINPDHLWLGTQGDNMRDKAAKGRARNQHMRV